MTRCEGDKVWRVRPLDQWVGHDKHGKFQYLLWKVPVFTDSSNSSISVF